MNRKPYEAASIGIGTVIGNQARETFDQTPRVKPHLPKPALPDYDKNEPYKYGQWTGNDRGDNTCTATDTWVTPGGQCG